MLKLEDISKTYKKNTDEIFVLDSIDLDIEKGKIIALTGESGAGKSTLLHIAGLLDKPDKGKIYYQLKEINVAQDLSHFRNQNFGFIFQFHYLLEDFNALENIAMPLLVGKTKMKKALEQAEKMLKLVGLGDRAKHFSNELSGGEQQRVAFARALVHNPAIVFADEPTGNLDPKTSEDILNLIHKLNKEKGQTFVIVTHNMEIAAQMDLHYRLENRTLSRIK